ncbi:plasmid mobilization protein [Insolitispirillum peregrinum]|uniref:Uncharacterized protein n=1 Tax=Insolitispirillum peregrinum TaxID=80876 RepID=A0A1N7MGL8_9PROT|nr:ribbon-helix-helix protein, CopG family [Insolitispirillum peregrinum]SIS85178.1 hypothetical protein SAMN05421779_104107 [Insolitispirillum peregrinum]
MELRSALLKAYVTVQEKKALEAEAARRGITLSDLLRAAALAELQKARAEQGE